MVTETPLWLAGIALPLVLAVPTLPAQSTLNRSVRTAENLEPVISRSEQDKAVATKLAARKEDRQEAEHRLAARG